MSGLAERLWVGLPGALARVSPLGGVVLGDGSYLRAIPPVAVLAPFLSAALGFAIGAAHTGEVFSYSVVGLLLFAGLAGLGAGLGAAAWVGFVAGDVLLLNGSGAVVRSGSSPGVWGHVSEVYAPLAISYVVLALLLMVTPVVATTARLALSAALKPGSRQALVGGYLAHALVQAALTAVWALSASFFIRPIWSFNMAAPPTEAIAPLQTKTTLLMAAAAAAVALRFAIVATSRADDRPLTHPPSPRRWPRPLAIGLEAIVLTALMAGLLASVVEAAIFALLVVGVLILRAVVVPRLAIHRSIVRVPVLLRLAAVLGVAYLLGLTILEPLAGRGVQSLRPVVVVLLISLAVAALLLPAGRAADNGEKA